MERLNLHRAKLSGEKPTHPGFIKHIDSDLQIPGEDVVTYMMPDRRSLVVDRRHDAPMRTSTLGELDPAYRIATTALEEIFADSATARTFEMR